MPDELIGREGELAAIARFLEAGPAPPAALVLEGEAGIGKTTVWRQGVELARARGYRVLTCRLGEIETAIAYAGLADLLVDSADEVSAQLPPPQRRALEIALLRAEASGPPPDRRAIAFALFGAFRTLARSSPILIAIDDVQWLDESSAWAIAFAARRLRDEPLRFLIASRHVGRDAAPPLGLGRTFGDRQLVRSSLGAFSFGAIQELVRTRVGVALPRSTLRRVYETSGGNPFFALELARALERRDAAPGEALPLPGTLVELINERLAALPAATERPLQIAALLSDPRVELVPATPTELAPAIDAEVIALSEGRIRFAHPLIASGLVARLDPVTKRQLHAHLAEIAPALEERARHLALSLDAPSERAASVIEGAARHAARRGAPAIAAELFELAVERTPTERSDDAARRVFGGAEQLVLAGELARARPVLERLSATLERGPRRAEVLVLLADIVGDLGPARALCEQALGETGDDTRLGAETLRQLAEIVMVSGDIRGALERARAAAALAERCDDHVVLVQCLGVVSHFETYTGEITPGLLEGAVALEAKTPHTRAHYGPAQILALRLMYADRLGEARAMLERALERARAAGDEYECRNILSHLAQLELRAGRWAKVDEYAAETDALFEVLGTGRETSAFLRAALHVHRGRVLDARAILDPAFAQWPTGPPGVVGLLLRWTRGFLELSLGNAAGAALILGPLADELLAIGYRNPGVRPVVPDAVEALIGAGQFDDASRLIAALEAGGRKLDNPWALATAARCTGLLLAARGDLTGALAALERSVADNERAASPFERARSLLAYGATLRRAKHRRAARETLHRALEEFERLGAALWAERARAELARIGGRSPRGQELTPTEQRIADLVALGKTNREVAADLFLSVHTVEASLTDIYSKLSVRSRTELAHLLPIKK